MSNQSRENWQPQNGMDSHVISRGVVNNKSLGYLPKDASWV